jgi:hypothetical protein
MVPSGALRLGCGTLNHSRIYGDSCARDSLKRGFVWRHLNDYERTIFIEGFGRETGSTRVAAAQLSRGAFGEIVDSFLRLYALIDMVVTRKDDANAIFNEQRL